MTVNGANMISAFEEEPHIRCVCHCLNLAVENGIRKGPARLSQLLTSCRELVTLFKRAGLQGKLQTTLKQDIVTRWNSGFIMMESILDQYDAVMNILEDRGDDHFTEDVSLKQLYNFVEFLSVSQDKEPSIHLVLPWFTKLQKHCQATEQDSLIISQLKPASLRLYRKKCGSTASITSQLFFTRI